MNVMNIKHYLSAVAALGLLAACSEYDPGMSDQAIDLTDAEIETIEEYRANFIARYGEPAEGHTWGFGAKGSEDEMGTRAVQVDRNMWTIVVYEDGEVKLKSTVGTYRKDDYDDYYNYSYIEKAGYKVPGFPSPIDDLYHFEKDGQTYAWTQQEVDAFEAQQTGVNEYNLSRSANLAPTGDVTDEEIQYVSWWFRTHPNPQSVTPPFKEFFIQDISQDHDRVSYPSGAQKNTAYTNMDYFSVKTSDGYWEHISNLNQQKANPISNTVPNAVLDGDTTALKTLTQSYPERTLKYWSSEGPYERGVGDVINRDGTAYTTSFSYHNSDDNTDYENYVLVHLKFVGPISGKLYDGYYLAFDYEFHKKEGVNNPGELTEIQPDGYYSNWIVKLAPGNPQWSDHKWYRIMCEDLGSTDDYDFNDLVYDVYFTGTGTDADPYVAHIVVQASGGTLPIYVATHIENEEFEAHKILQGGNAKKMTDKLYQPVNVSAGVTTNPSNEILFVMKDKNGNLLTGDAGTDPDNIPILVTSLDNSRQTAAGKNTFILLTAEKNPTPQKICIPGNKVLWMKERKQIETSYTNFDKWVTGGTGSAYDFGGTQDWTVTGVNPGNLY